MVILGTNAFDPNSLAALVRDDVLAAAAEEERFRRGDRLSFMRFVGLPLHTKSPHADDPAPFATIRAKQDPKSPETSVARNFPAKWITLLPLNAPSRSAVYAFCTGDEVTSRPIARIIRDVCSLP